MTPLRAFLYLRSDTGTNISVHREFETLNEVWAGRPSSDCSGFIHLGFTRPDVDDVLPLLESNSGRMLLSASAKYALPVNIKSSAVAIDTVDDLPIFMCLSGFGYEITDDPSATRSTETTTAVASFPTSFGRNDRWLEGFFNFTDYSNALLAAGINSDDSYIQHEHKLPTEFRMRLAKGRYKFFVGNDPTSTQIIGYLRYCPPWMLSRRLGSFPLSVRAANVMSANSIDTFADLSRFGEAQIRRFVHLGKKTYDEISEVAEKLFECGPELADINNQSTIPRIPSGEPESLPTTNVEIHTDSEDFRSFVAAWDFAFQTLRDVDKSVISQRAGIDGEPKTLQEISDQMSVTRERVRQIESRAILAMSHRLDWEQVLGRRIRSVLDGRTDGLHFHGLEVFDPWFIKLSSFQPQFEFAIEHLLHDKFYFIRIGLQVFVSRISQRKWEQSVREARKVLTAVVDDRLPLSQVRLMIDSLIAGDADDLKNEFWIEASKYAHFSNVDGQEYYVGYGYGIEPKILKILETSDTPLHYTEVHRRLIDSGEDSDLRRCANGTAAVGLLYGRGLYGTLRHLKFSPLEKESIISKCLDFVLAEGPERQWHAGELVDYVASHLPSLGERLDKFNLSIVLKDSSEFVYLGRLVWVLKSTGATGTANRIDRLQATIATIRDAGVPLTQKQIKDRISAERGLGEFFQIFPEGPLVKIDPSRWGLLDRDVRLSDVQIVELQNGLEAVLNERQNGIHLSEIQQIVDRFLPEASQLDPYCLFSLANRSNKFNSSPTDYIFLREWGNPKRMGVLEACYKVLKDADGAGITKSDGVLKVSSLIERDLTQNEQLNLFGRADGIYDPLTKLWRLDEDLDE